MRAPRLSRVTTLTVTGVALGEVWLLAHGPVYVSAYNVGRFMAVVYVVCLVAGVASIAWTFARWAASSRRPRR